MPQSLIVTTSGDKYRVDSNDRERVRKATADCKQQPNYFEWIMVQHRADDSDGAGQTVLVNPMLVTAIVD